jgi:hypothetical protein
MALQIFSEVAEEGCCPKCGYAIMKRGVNAVTGNLAVGLAAAVVTGGLLGPARKQSSAGAAEPSTCRADHPDSSARQALDISQ